MTVILSWNVNLFSVKSGFDIDARADTILYTIMELNPDIICLQESSKFFNNRLTEKGYILLGAIKSHCGYTCSFVKKLIYDKIQTNNTTNINGNYHYIFKDDDINIANFHIEPKAFNIETLDQILSRIIKKDTDKWLFIGDFNTEVSLSNTNLIDIAQNQNLTENTWTESFLINDSRKEMRYDRAIKFNTNIYDLKVHRKYFGQSDHLPVSVKYV